MVTTAEAVHARIAKSEMLKPCRPMEARGPGEFVLFYSGPESGCRNSETLERADAEFFIDLYYASWLVRLSQPFATFRDLLRPFATFNIK